MKKEQNINWPLFVLQVKKVICLKVLAGSTLILDELEVMGE